MLKFHACDFSTQNIPMLPISLRMAYKFLHNLPPFYPNPVPHLLLLLSPSTAATLLFLDPSRHAPGSRPLHLLSPCLDPFLLPRMCLLGKVRTTLTSCLEWEFPLNLLISLPFFLYIFYTTYHLPQ